MPQIQMKKLLSNGESERLEFKSTINLDSDHHKRGIVKIMISMANAKGGQIIVGYDEKTKSVLNAPEELKDEDRLRQIVVSRSFPPVDFSIKLEKCNNRTLAVIMIPESKIKPHQDSEHNVWIRRGKITDRADPKEIVLMQRLLKARPHKGPEMKWGRERIKEDYAVSYEVEPGIFQIPHGTSSHRLCMPLGQFAEPASFAVFLPTFDSYCPTPEFDDSQSVLMLEEQDVSIYAHTQRDILEFLKRLEAVPYLLSLHRGRWNLDRLYWTLTRKKSLVYGSGATQAFQALRDYTNGVFNGIVQFSFGDYYNPTSMILVSLELREIERKIRISRVELRLILSTIPTSWKLARKIFSITEPLRKQLHKILPISSDSCTLRKVGYLVWRPERVTDIRIPLEPVAALSRYVGSKPKFNQPRAVIVHAKAFQHVEYELDRNDSWQADWYGEIFERAPVHYFTEFPLTLTNPVPLWIELVQKKWTYVTAPVIRQLIFGALGGCLINCINFHSLPMENKTQ